MFKLVGGRSRGRAALARGLRITWAILLIVVVSTWILPPNLVEAGNRVEWSWLDPLPLKTDLLSVIFAEGQFMAVGRYMTVLTSRDGENWSVKRTSLGNNTMDIVAVAFGNGRYVALGREFRISTKTYVPLTSSDGTSWTVHHQQAITRQEYSQGEYSDLPEIEFDGSQFVIRFTYLQQATHYLSSDGVAWSLSPSYDPSAFPRVSPTAPGPHASGNGVYVAVVPEASPSTKTVVHTSTNGQRWSERTTLTGRLTDIAFGNGRFVAIGHRLSDYDAQIVTSTDGLNWTSQIHRADPKSSWYMEKVATGNGTIVITARKRLLVVSGNGTTSLVELNDPALTDLTDVAFANGKFILAGVRGYAQTAIYESTNGRDWILRWESPQDNRIGAITAAEAGILIWMNDRANGPYPVLSPDGERWTAHPNLDKRFTITSAVRGNNLYVAVGYLDAGWLPAVFTSHDGVNWVYQNPGPKGRLDNVIFANGQFVAVGSDSSDPTNQPLLLTSRDGVSWTIAAANDSLSAPEPISVAYHGGVYVAVTQGRVLYSVDGRTWAVEHTHLSLESIVSTNQGFVAVGPDVILSGIVPTCQELFADLTSNKSACEAVKQLHIAGVVSGYPDGTYRPNNQVSRAEIAKMLLVALGEHPDPQGNVTFQDVSGHWITAQGYLQKAVKIGVIQGFSPTRFAPDDPVTRAQLAKLVTAALGRVPAGTPPPYSDVNDWSTGWVAAGYQAGLFGPNAAYPIWTDSVLDSERPVTRAEAALVLANLLGLRD